jgi:hypothetical protein
VNLPLGCNGPPRAAVTRFVDDSRHASAWAASAHAEARSRGCKHPHAIRVLARARARVPWRAWQDNAPYDPRGHRAAARIST